MLAAAARKIAVGAAGHARKFASQPPELVRSSLASLFLRLAGLASTFCLGVLLARALGPAQYGIYGLVIASATLIGTVANLGTPQLAVREFSIFRAKHDWSRARSLHFIFTTVTIVVSVVLGAVVIGTYLLAWPERPQILTYLIQGAILAPLLALTGLMASELRGLGAMLKGQFLDILGKPALAAVVFGIALVVRGTIDATDALWVQIVVGIVAVAISYHWLRTVFRDAGKGIGPRWQFAWLAAALPLGAVDIIRQLDGAYGMFVMGWLSSAQELGIFRVALSCGVVVSLPATIVHIVLAPKVSELFRLGTRDDLQKILRSASASLVAVLSAATFALVLIAKPAISLVFGAEYAGAWLPLVILCFGQLILGFFGMGPILLAMCGEERALFKIYAIAVGLAAAASLPLIHFYDSTGAAIAQAISTLTIGVLSWRHARNKLGLEITFTGKPPQVIA